MGDLGESSKLSQFSFFTNKIGILTRLLGLSKFDELVNVEGVKIKLAFSNLTGYSFMRQLAVMILISQGLQQKNIYPNIHCTLYCYYF